jgi:hypothetical protein
VLSTEESSEPGRLCGIRNDDAVLIQESNDTVVWLPPQPVIAKVATPADSAEVLIREHEVAVRWVWSISNYQFPFTVCTCARANGPNSLWIRVPASKKLDVDSRCVGKRPTYLRDEGENR